MIFEAVNGLSYSNSGITHTHTHSERIIHPHLACSFPSLYVIGVCADDQLGDTLVFGSAPNGCLWMSWWLFLLLHCSVQQEEVLHTIFRSHFPSLGLCLPDTLAWSFTTLLCNHVCTFPFFYTCTDEETVQPSGAGESEMVSKSLHTPVNFEWFKNPEKKCSEMSH